MSNSEDVFFRDELLAYTNARRLADTPLAQLSLLAAIVAEAVRLHTKDTQAKDERISELEIQANGWRCFHCDRRFLTVTEAGEHFGKAGERMAACESSLKAVIEDAVERLADGNYVVSRYDADDFVRVLIERALDAYGRAEERESSALREKLAALEARSISPKHPALTAQINAAPEPLRTYVYELETLADPTGNVQELVARRENQKGLEILLTESRAEVERLTKALGRATEAFSSHLRTGCNFSAYGEYCSPCAALADIGKLLEDHIASETAMAFCDWCRGGSRSLPVERHGSTSFVHYTGEGEELICNASPVKLLEEQVEKLKRGNERLDNEAEAVAHAVNKMGQSRDRWRDRCERAEKALAAADCLVSNLKVARSMDLCSAYHCPHDQEQCGEHYIEEGYEGAVEYDIDQIERQVEEYEAARSSPGQPEGEKAPRHHCGLSGYNPMVDERCPGCAERENG